MPFRVRDTLVPGAKEDQEGKIFPVVDAKYVSLNEDETQYLNTYLADLNETINKLKERIEALESGTVTLDKDEIEKLISQVEGLEEDEYTISSWEDLDVAYDAAKNARDNATTQGELDTAAAALEQAINNLRKRITFKIGNTSYTADPDMTWFAWANNESYNTSENPKITCDSNTDYVYCGELHILSGTSYVLGNQQISSNGSYTIETQSTEVDKTDLIAAIRKAEQTIEGEDETDYTSESWTNLENALGAAQTVYYKTSSTQVEVDNATLALNDAIDALEKIPETEEPTGIVDTIIANKTPMYSISATGELTEIPFKLLNFDTTTASAEPTESGFYQITDSAGNVIESGYQELQSKSDETYYVIALPKEIDYHTMVTMQAYSTALSKWMDAENFNFTNESTKVAAICAEAGIDISAIDTEIYSVWAVDECPTGSKLRFIITE